MSADLRNLFLDVDPADARLEPTPELPRVYGAMLEIGYPEGCATLGVLADGHASLYFSNGGGILGGVHHERVRAAARQLVETFEFALDRIPPSADKAFPATGNVVLRALTYDGPHAIEILEDDLREHRHELWTLFYRGHEVLTELRLISERGQ